MNTEKTYPEDRAMDEMKDLLLIADMADRIHKWYSPHPDSLLKSERSDKWLFELKRMIHERFTLLLSVLDFLPPSLKEKNEQSTQ